MYSLFCFRIRVRAGTGVTDRRHRLWWSDRVSNTGFLVIKEVTYQRNVPNILLTYVGVIFSLSSGQILPGGKSPGS